MICILLGALKYRLIFLRALTVFDEPLGESNTERQVKNQPVFQKKESNDTFIVKFKNFTPGVKILVFKCNKKN